MTEAVARHLFPNSGVYESASLTPTEAVDPELLTFLGARGLDASPVSPKRFDKLPFELSEYHVIVSLQGPIGDYIEQVPFHTATLEWDVGEAGSGGRWDYEAAHRAVSVHLRQLMEQLRGPEAD
jgi:protein-tyrosine-phosphatase